MANQQESYEALIERRRKAELPSHQQLIPLYNTGNSCYANAGVNFLPSSPYFSQLFFHLPTEEEHLFHALANVSRNKPNVPHYLTELCEAVAEQLPEARKFLEPTEEDVTEWIMLLLQAIEQVIQYPQKEDFKSRFNIIIRVTSNCDRIQFCHEDERTEKDTMFHLSVLRTSNNQPLTKLKDIIESYFKVKKIDRNCPA